MDLVQFLFLKVKDDMNPFPQKKKVIANASAFRSYFIFQIEISSNA